MSQNLDNLEDFFPLTYPDLEEGEIPEPDYAGIEASIALLLDSPELTWGVAALTNVNESFQTIVENGLLPPTAIEFFAPRSIYIDLPLVERLNVNNRYPLRNDIDADTRRQELIDYVGAKVHWHPFYFPYEVGNNYTIYIGFVCKAGGARADFVYEPFDKFTITSRITPLSPLEYLDRRDVGNRSSRAHLAALRPHRGIFPSIRQALPHSSRPINTRRHFLS